MFVLRQQRSWPVSLWQVRQSPLHQHCWLEPQPEPLSPSSSCRALWQTPLFFIAVLSQPVPKAKPDSLSPTCTSTYSGLDFYDAGDSKRSGLKYHSPSPAPSSSRKPHFEGSQRRAGGVRVWRPIFPCLIYILHFCKIMLRVFW